MFHLFNALTNTRGDSLVGYQVVVRQPGNGAVMPIFADQNGTPIAAVSALTNVALTDNAGNYSLFVDFGTYDLEFRTPDGVFISVVRQVPMNGGAQGSPGREGPPGPPGTGSILSATPEMFGAVGDGVTNDHAAFDALSAYINARGGGSIEMRPGATYIVGNQTRGRDGRAWGGTSPLAILGATKLVRIIGNGATIKAAAGYRYGMFDAVSGAPIAAGGAGNQYGSPWLGIVDIQDCQAGYTIDDLVLDGNVQNAIIGGTNAGDDGRQIQGCGLWLRNNRGPVAIRGVRCPNNPWDGAYFNHIGKGTGLDRRFSGILIERYSAPNCGRQALSVTGGIGGKISLSQFNDTSRAIGFASNPASGIDFEAEGTNEVREWAVDDCEFDNNAGQAVTGTVSTELSFVEGLVFNRCKFIGATGYAAYLVHPRMKFVDCTVVGPMLQAWNGDANPEKQTQMIRCLLTDDPAYSPTGVVWQPNLSIYATTTPQGVLFDGCTFRLISAGLTLPSSGPNAIYRNCRGYQASANTVVMQGKFEGRNEFTTAGALNYLAPGTRIYGHLVINGVDQQAMTFNAGAGTVAAGASYTADISIPGVKSSDKVAASQVYDAGPLAFLQCQATDGSVRLNFFYPVGGSVPARAINIGVARASI